MYPVSKQSIHARRKWMVLLGACLVLLGADGAALGGQRTVLPGFLLRSWDSEDGLPASRVQAIAQTDDGYLWIATTHGLARFDGVRFQILDTNNTPALGDNRITSLLLSRSGDLWVGTEGGYLSRRRGGVFERISLENTPRGFRINSLTEDHDTVLWIGTRGGGVARWCQGKSDWFSVGGRTNSPDNDVSQIITDRQGRLWAIANEKLATYANGTNVIFPEIRYWKNPQALNSTH
jgi:ligand-binding sensor domain-containing protein